MSDSRASSPGTPERDADAPAIVVTDWATDGARLAAVRRAVFVREQGIPEALELDAADASAVHVLAIAKREPVGTGRLLPSGKIGRLAVLPTHRRFGVGGRMRGRLIELARERGITCVYLHAQVDALGFYAARGFVAEGAEFDEAGVRHRRMRLAVSAQQHADSEADRAAHDPVDR